MNQKGIGPSYNCLQSEVKLFIKIYSDRVCFSQAKKTQNKTKKSNNRKKIKVKKTWIWIILDLDFAFLTGF